MSTGIVLYTDGGARPNNGYGGWGVHGYEYDDALNTKGTGLKDWYITPSGYFHKEDEVTNKEWIDIWSPLGDLGKDSTVKNVNVLNYFEGIGGLGIPISNNVAELEGLAAALRLLLKQEPKHAVIYCDSRYALDGLTQWIDEWSANNWTRKGNRPISNLEYWKSLYTLRERITESNINVTYNWVKGHVGNVGNEKADHLATCGVILSKKTLVEETIDNFPAKGYWTPKSEPIRLAPYKYWYFNTSDSEPVKTSDGRFIYHLGDHGKDDEMINKRIADSTFMVFFSKEKNELMEIVRREQIKLNTSGNNTLVIGKLENTLRASTAREISDTDGRYLHTQKDISDLYTPSDIQITKELNPPRIAFNLVNIMNILEGTLNDYIFNNTKSSIVATDITDTLYVENAKGKPILDTAITNNVKKIPVSVHYDLGNGIASKDINLSIGLDILNRNSLANISKSDPKVLVVTWKESANAFRYATIVESDGNIGIYANFHSNLTLVK